MAFLTSLRFGGRIDVVWASGQEGFNELRIDAPHLGMYLSLTLDLVAGAVSSLNKFSVNENLRHLGQFVVNTWCLVLIKTFFIYLKEKLAMSFHLVMLVDVAHVL